MITQIMNNQVLNSKNNCDIISQHYKTPKATFLPVVINGKLVFKIDLTRGLVEWQHQGQKYLIDLATLEEVR